MADAVMDTGTTTTASPAAAAGASRNNNLFREIHKNTWLKRLHSVGEFKKLPVVKKSEKFWVVFCVHDDFEALLEGYTEPRLAPTHLPDWTVPLQSTQHVTHSLVAASEHDYEFVITLSNDVIRFSASSWDMMQEWVDTLRSKLREMKIISPRENLYSRLPEIRPPLLPTRDPTSPLPAPPPVPAALVPGIERVVPPPPPVVTAEIAAQTVTVSAAVTPASTITDPSVHPTIIGTTVVPSEPSVSVSVTTQSDLPPNESASSHVTTISTEAGSEMITSPPVSAIPSTSMSNTLTQNLINMLSNPIANLTSRLAMSRAGNIRKINDDDDDDDDDEDDDEDFLNRPSTSTGSAFLMNAALLDENDEDDLASNSTLSSARSASPGISMATAFTNHVLNTQRNFGGAKKTQEEHVSKCTTSAKAEKTESCSSVEIAPILIPRPHTNKSATIATVQNLSSSLARDKFDEPEGGDEVSNITIIRVSDPLTIKSPEFRANIEVNSSSQQQQQQVTTVSVRPETKKDAETASSNGGYGQICKSGSGVTNISVSGAISNVRLQPTAVTVPPPASVLPPSATTRSAQIYEPVFVTQNTAANNTANPSARAPQSPTVFLLAHQPRSASHTEIAGASPPTAATRRIKVGGTDAIHAAASSSVVATVDSSNHCDTIEGGACSTLNGGATPSSPAVESPGVSSRVTSKPRFLLTRGVTELVISRSSRIDSKAAASRQQPRHQMANPCLQLPQRISPKKRPDIAAVVESRRRSSSTSGDRRRNETGVNRSPAVSPPSRSINNIMNGHNNGGGGRQGEVQQLSNGQKSARLSLREQQVFQLRREMMHPGGVRLQLRRKDCVGAIAWVEAFGSVWVAGWKQKDHPMLYNALHIGDQLISVGGVTVATSAEANKLMRTVGSGIFVELIIRRVPFGRVYAIRRELDGQCLGLIRDNNTATIVDVIPNGLAARHGLPAKAPSCDGLSLTFWVLTEINGRSLNLFFKDNEIQDRLNAVGRDISILVQPLDLMVKLKKQLKSLRGHKEFIVQ